MTRFEEVQMKMAESAKGYLEVFNIQVFIEQFSLTRESRFSLTLPGMEDPYPVSATVSLTFDVFQTGMSMYDDIKPEEDGVPAENTLELDVIIRLPIMEGYPDIEGLMRDIERQYPESEPVLLVKEFYGAGEPAKEYELSYAYDLDTEDLADSDTLDSVFEELRGIMELVYEKTKYNIDQSWYRGEDDPAKGY
ncbi:MAG TPA: hypothetical protein VK448_11880 [Dissulfurispiraceae bacterium]|nr:hypothetical protein [Dissulfurispiraceae bacterium]